MTEEDKVIKVPKAVRKMLLTDERAMGIIRQSRLKAAATPDFIVITNQRIIRYSPSALGLHKEIEDHRYEDIANLKMEKGILFATITLKHRFMSQDLILDNLPSRQVDSIFRLIQENLKQQMSGASVSSAAAGQPTPPGPPQDPLQVLKLRYARGEITREEFEEMKSVLE
jgi:hypothetical protein